MKENKLIDLRAKIEMNILSHKKGILCKNCGHYLVLVNGDLHHLYEFISWSESKTQRKLRCDSYRPHGQISCNCELPEMDDKSKDEFNKQRILREMVISKEGE